MLTGEERRDFLHSLDKKEYLGDGVYVGERSDGVLTLYTDNGITIYESIYLDDSVLLALFKYTKKIF